MDNNSIEVFDNLPTFEMSLPIDVKKTMVYIAGYIVRNYFDKFGDFTEELSRGGLAKPNDTSCQYVFLGYILFREIMHDVCPHGYCRYIFFKC